MVRKKLSLFLVGVAALILPLIVTAQPAVAATPVSVELATAADPTDIGIQSWFYHTEWQTRSYCLEYGQWLVDNYSTIYCNYSCRYKSGWWELWMEPCGFSGESQPDLPAVKL